jgi:hypothetical protein
MKHSIFTTLARGDSCNIFLWCVRSWPHNLAACARTHRCGKSGNRDARTMSRGIASWLQSAVGRQNLATDISAEN